MPNGSGPSTPAGGGGSAASGVGEQARQLKDDVTQSAQAFAEEGKAKGADRLQSVAETVDRVADQVADESPAMAEWVRKAASELDDVSRKLKDKSVGDLLTIGRDFARREPAAFLAASAVAGFAQSRLLKSTSSSASQTSGTAAATGRPAPVPGGEPAAAPAAVQPPVVHTPKPMEAPVPPAASHGVGNPSPSPSQTPGFRPSEDGGRAP